ncbi:MAG TPA: hypothetical protein H9834_09680, partial [Candidatus Barnesiella excrementavium]|nr:hypothetical protein [Candidatus Barnesiella excrementavium]
SPLLYQLSYGTIIFVSAKIELNFIIHLIFYDKNEKDWTFLFFMKYFWPIRFCFSQTLCIFVPANPSAGCSTVG